MFQCVVLLRNLDMTGASPSSSTLPTAELGAGDGGGDSDVEALGSLAGRIVVGDEQLVGDELTDSGRDAVALVAHNDDALAGELLMVDVLAVEQGAVDGAVVLAQQRLEVGIDDVDVCQRAHRGLHHLGVVAVGSVLGTVDGGDAKPVGNADNGA